MKLGIFPTQTISDVGDGWVHVKLPKGSVYYHHERHAYHLVKPDGTRGKRLTSPSTLSKPADFDPSKLMSWAAKTNGKGIARLVGDILRAQNGQLEPEYFEWLTSHETIWDTLVENELTFNHLRDAAGERGTNVHLALEDLARGQMPNVAAYPEEERGYVSALLQWWLDADPEVLNSEQFVLHSELGFAGRFDLRARTKGRVTMVDAKTSNYISPGYAAQMILYDLAAESCGVGASDDLLILQLRSDGMPRPIPVVSDREWALAVLATYRGSKAVERELGKAA